MATGGTSEPLLICTAVAPYVDGPAGVHGVLVQAGRALSELGEAAGLAPRVIEDPAGLAPEDLARGGVLALFTIGEVPFSPAQRAALVETWRSGALGVLAVHSATDACHTWPDYGAVVGARFDGHPWTQDFTVSVVDPDHPATAHLPARWPWRDEVYLFKDLRPDARVLLRGDPAELDLSAPGARVPDIGLPLAWCHEDGAGRTFYTALGHFPGAWETPTYLRHLAGGLDWVRRAA